MACHPLSIFSPVATPHIASLAPDAAAPGRLIDLSLSSVSLATEIRPPVGELVLIGQMAARIARHHGTGIGIEFLSQHSAVVEPVRPKLFVAR